MSAPFDCPCDAPTDAPPQNAPGLSAIAYRDTGWAAIRSALLTPQPGETQLRAWRPGASGDLAVMMAEWWAYLGDILTFYNERIANEDYLRTATQAQSVRNLVGVLGYRPKPGVAATATLAALVQPGPRFSVATVLPAGLQVQSKPGPGQPPQTFELTAPTAISAPDLVVANPPLALLSPNAGTLLLAGAVSSILGGAKLLLRPRDGSSPSLVWVEGAAVVTLPGGARQTQLSVYVSADTSKPAAAFRLDRPGQTAGLWSLTSNAIDASGNVHLSGLVRTLSLGDAVLFLINGGAVLTTVTGIVDVVWDSTGATPTKTSTALFPHTRLTLAQALPSGAAASNTTLQFGWSEVATLVDQPIATWPAPGAPVPATLVGATPFGAVGASGVLVADVSGAGVLAQAVASSDLSTLSVSGLGDPAPVFQTPLSVLFNLLPFTCGKTVPPETLGGGDPTLANQSFQLAKSPLTYLRQGAALASTLSVTVNGQTWSEVASLYGQPPDALVYVTSQDAAAKTTIQFGDGVNGARPAAGSANIVARYRIGGGAAAPPAGALTVIASPYPGLRALRNPLPAGGGADPDPPDQIRAYAPRSVLTFGRAVSALDFEAIAAGAAGGARVAAAWAWDAAAQRAAVTLYVAATGTTLADVAAAVQGAGDPNRPVTVSTAPAITVELVIQVLIAASADGAAVQAALVTALADPMAGLFGAQALGIGQPVFDSQIAAACQGVAGVVAVTALSFYRQDAGWEADPLHVPPQGSYFDLDPADVSVQSQAAGDG